MRRSRSFKPASIANLPTAQNQHVAKKMKLGKALDFPPYLFNEIQIVDTPKSLRTRMDIGSAEGWL